MSKRRDRHNRGLRGPLATVSPFTGAAAPLRRRQSSEEFFVGAVSDAVARVGRACPQAVEGVAIGIEEVPRLTAAWHDEQVPLAAALERTEDTPAQIVVYRRPLEHRATSRRDLEALVHRTVVEQLTALTGIPEDTLDPGGERD